jgi:hypothetical protein
MFSVSTNGFDLGKYRRKVTAPLIENAKTAKFQIEFMLLMLSSGRGDEALAACHKALDALSETIAKEEPESAE